MAHIDRLASALLLRYAQGGCAVRLSGSKFQCWHCRRHFAGERAFARHRADLQCLTSDELLALGMVITAAGFWELASPRSVDLTTQPLEVTQ
jgi:hypothetical protein